MKTKEEYVKELYPYYFFIGFVVYFIFYCLVAIPVFGVFLIFLPLKDSIAFTLVICSISFIIEFLSKIKKVSKKFIEKEYDKQFLKEEDSITKKIININNLYPNLIRLSPEILSKMDKTTKELLLKDMYKVLGIKTNEETT